MPLRSTNEPLTFARDIIWIGLSQIFISLLGIITLPALTKSFTSETYGIWVQISTTVGLVAPLLTLQFGSAVVRFLAGENDRAVRSRTIGTMLAAILIAACLVLSVTFMIPSQMSEFLFADPSYSSFVYLTFIWTLFDALFTFFMAYLRSRRQIKRISLLQAGLAISKVGIIIALAEAGLSLQWIVAGMILINLVFLCGIFYMFVRREGFPTPNFFRIREFLAFSLPQTPSGVLLWIINASDRYFITHFLGLSQTGVYFSSHSLGAMVALFYAPISFVLLPTVSQAWDQNRKSDVKNYFEHSTRLFLTLAVPAAVGLAFLSQPLLKILATSEYLVGWPLVLMISIGTIFLGIYQINLYIIYLVKQTRWLPLMIVAASAVTIILCVLLLPRIGIVGAAVANISSYFILAAIVTFWTRKTLQYSFDTLYLGKVILASVLMGAGVYFLRPQSPLSIIIGIAAGVAIFVLALWLMRAFSSQDKELLRQLLWDRLPARFKPRK